MAFALTGLRAFKAFIILSMIVLIPTALTNILLGPHPMWLVLLIALAWVLDLGFRSETRLARVLGVKPEPLESSVGDPALQETLRRVAENATHARLPRVTTFQSPLPHLIVARSWMSRGTLFVSEGMLAILSEDEMRAVLQMGMNQVATAGMPIRSWFCVIAVTAARRLPDSWRRRFLATAKGPASSSRPMGEAFGGILFLIFLPFLRACLELTRGEARGEASENVDPIALRRAVNKVRAATGACSGTALPGSAMVSGLYLFDPGSAWMLFPIA